MEDKDKIRIEDGDRLQTDTDEAVQNPPHTGMEEPDPYDFIQISAKGKNLTKFDIWERKLLDFTLRNTLLNMSPRRRAVQFITFDINHVHNLVQNGSELSITPCPDDEHNPDASTSFVRSEHQEHLRIPAAKAIKKETLHTYLDAEDTKSRLKNIYRAARNSMEESGANALFLSIGALRWYEDERSNTPRFAPLLLLPVEMVYKKGHYHIRTRDEDIILNITLMEFLRQNYDISAAEVDPLPLSENGVDVERIFGIIRNAIKDQERWSIEEECILGIFSFSKFLMWSDIHNHRETLAENPIIGSLVANRLKWTPESPTTILKELDNRLSPEETVLPVQADSSQLAAVVEGETGNSFIIYGPPGTGKSQTITNLIANSLYHGKRVLFVAEKMAALSVVQSRLAKIGLAPFCLELHSNKSTKRHVLQQLEEARDAVQILPPEDFAKQAERILQTRRDLMAYLTALHATDEKDGLSAYDCIVMSESFTEEPMDGFEYDPAIDIFISREGIKGVEQLLGSRLATILRLVGAPARHPLNGMHVDRTILKDSDKISMEMKKDATSLYGYSKEAPILSEAVTIRERLTRDSSAALLDEDPEELRQLWRNAKAKWIIPRFFAKKGVIKRLREYNPMLTEGEAGPLIDDLVSYRKMHEKISIMNGILHRHFKMEQKEDEVPDPSMIIERADILVRWAENTHHMRDWLHWEELSDELRLNGMKCVVDVLNTRLPDPTTIKDSFLKALFRHKAQAKLNASETLSAFEGLLFDEKSMAYRRLTEEYRNLTCKELYARLASRLPRMAETSNAGKASEIGLLNRNISNGGRGLSLRDLFDQLPTLMPRLCPCMLMSPNSVAKYIDISADKYDIVIFDEASQIPTSEAVGAIARGKSLIVVGDPKQMPPTSFFNSMNVEEEEAPIDDMESILEDCRTLEFPSLQLSWHYRSRHESLIAFSNAEYYDGTLITFPSVDDKDTKVHLVPVAGGVYEKGGRRWNIAEAEAIVDEIERRLSNAKLRHQSIGVIAFSIMQQGLIEDLLQDRLEQDRKLQKAALDMHEPIFVKNLENVQGDERDVILFSIGYGPDKEGKISMNFGPLNNPGGERRLNVAVSRARQEMYVFSTLKSSDIDLSRSKARGVEGLKHFLQYAETQQLSPSYETEATVHDNAVADRIAEELESRGYRTTLNVGRSKFRVDVAVEDSDHPGTYLLAILLDGKTYRDTLTANDREVVQPSVLEDLNWNVMRIWSVDWFNNKERVIGRIIENLERNSKWRNKRKAPGIPAFNVFKEKAVTYKSHAMPYRYFETDTLNAIMMDTELLIRELLDIEQPMTFPLICRRVSELRGNRPSQRTIENVELIVKNLYTANDGSVWLKEGDSLDYTTYRQDSDREASELPEIEMMNAIKEVLMVEIALQEGNLAILAAKRMGYARRRPSIEGAFKKAIEKMLACGTIESAGDSLRLKET